MPDGTDEGLHLVRAATPRAEWIEPACAAPAEDRVRTTNCAGTTAYCAAKGAAVEDIAAHIAAIAASFPTKSACAGRRENGAAHADRRGGSARCEAASRAEDQATTRRIRCAAADRPLSPAPDSSSPSG